MPETPPQATVPSVNIFESGTLKRIFEPVVISKVGTKVTVALVRVYTFETS